MRVLCYCLAKFQRFICFFRAAHELPDLPDFPLSLKPDDYELPDIDPSWEFEKCEPQVQTLKAHLDDQLDEVEIK